MAFKFRFLEEFRHILYICGDHVVWYDILCKIKPELGHFCKDYAFVGNGVFQNIIKCGNSVCGIDYQILSDIKDLTNFSFFKWFVLLHTIHLSL